ncbi:winged helix-turn-helix transcriptional regulator [Micromonospora sp. NBC_01813]|uniref:winged helix-turn-helix transcriptional regulator n=1 Tax=Micromonospora sp. NBC_01813 TaxID=2975988 RepID=UPI002DDC25FE|nr:response regulator transcription factor [Micromonospora sp. NBC_01813]WSA12869.1 response regulator transcription factor [Micromonospora sp. NBC_01813]
MPVEILVLTTRPHGEQARRVLPALDLLPHSVRLAGHDVSALMSGPDPDVVLVDARQLLAEARGTCRMLRTTGLRVPLVAVVEEAGLVAVSAEWGLDDLVLASAGPAEVETRLRLLVTRREQASGATGSLVTSGDLSIDPDTYAAKLKGRPLDLTFKEFELLKFLAQHPGRVFTRDQLLREVWGFDYFGGHRTVDVHVRRLRAKLGTEYESMIGTVRQVGYKLVLPPRAEGQIMADELAAILA